MIFSVSHSRLLTRREVEKVIGRPLKWPEQIHHFDENPTNRDHGNLVLCNDNQYHDTLHLRKRAFDNSGHAHWRHCHFCDRWDTPKGMIPFGNGGMAHLECIRTDGRERAERRRRNRGTPIRGPRGPYKKEVEK